MSIGSDNTRWVRPAGSATNALWDTTIGNDIDGWVHTGLLTARLDSGDAREVDLSTHEAVVVPLAGGVRLTVTHDGQPQDIVLEGRESVWSGPTDVAYVPRGALLTLTAEAPAEIAVCLAADTAADTAAEPGPAPSRVAAQDVPVELRGAGIASRQVRNFGVPGVLDARRMIACEVITPAGNWSSWPPHKHDTERPGVETELEEIYYFRTRSTDPRGTDPMGYQRVYAAGARPIDVLAEVRSGDVVLVPHGWHGPAIAAPNADLYYLNVMAGPGPERAWLICDDPAHAWVRESWTITPIDPRLL